MHNQRTKRARRLSIVACSAGALFAPQALLAQDGPGAGMESEASTIVVTGSRIARSEGVAPASPVEVIGAERLETTSTNTMATMLKDLPANFGSSFASGRGLGTGERGSGTINLRGLGAAATLVLVDGQRTTQLPDAQDNFVDINTLLPQIMVERVEIVKDGASAIYGSDAVAGVVNFITNDSFTGLRIDGRFNHFTYSNEGDRRIEAMFGAPLGDRGHFVMAAGYFDQDPMFLGSDVKILEGEAYDARWSAGGRSLVLPTRDTAGNLTGASRRFADPLCGEVPGAFPSTGVTVGGIAERLPSAAGASECRIHFYPEGSAQSGVEQFQTYGKLRYEILDGVELTATTAYTTSRALSYWSSWGIGALSNPVLPSHNPGNVFRAVDAEGRPLYAVSSGVSAGYSRDGVEVFLPARNAAGQIILADDPYDPNSGIAFNEDVSFTGAFGTGTQGGMPTGGSLVPPAYALSRPSRSDNDLIRAGVGLSGEVGEGWTWQAGANYTRYTIASNGAVGEALQSQAQNALWGLGGLDCRGTAPGRNGCEYYNPLFSSAFAAGSDDPQANSRAVVDYIFPNQLDVFRSSLLVGDVSISGTLLDLPAGPVGVAIGAQSRRATLSIDYDINKNIRNVAGNGIFYDFDERRTTNAIFAETIVPILDNDFGYLEFSGAVRHERATGFRTTDPKLGILFNTSNRLLTLRGTYGTSFVAPSLFRLFAVSGGLGAINDVCANPVCTGNLNQVVQTQTQGNPDLRPESAETFNIGGTVRPFDGFSLSVDWWRYNFRDRIATEQPQDVVNMDPDGSLTGRVIRSLVGTVAQVTTQYFNAPSVITEGLDISARYNADLENMGRVSASLSATYVPVYKFQQTPGGAFENYAGQENQRRAGVAAASPKWRGNLFLGWELGSHSVNSSINYIDSLIFNKDGRISPTLNPDFKVDSFVTVDLSYTFRLDDRILPGAIKGASITVGATNLFDADVPELPIPASQKFVGTLYDLRGQMLWLGLRTEF